MADKTISALTAASSVAATTVVPVVRAGASTTEKATLAQVAAQVAVDASGFTQTGTGAVARSIAAKLQDTVSVRDFGAIGDASADDTDAVQAALDTGRSVYFPKGRYRVTETLLMATSGQALLGYAPNANASEIIFANGSGDGIVVGSLLTPTDGLVFRDLRLTGSSKTGGALLVLNRVTRSRLENVVCANPWNGIKLYGFNDVSLTNVVCSGVAGEYGLLITGDDVLRWNVVNLTNYRSSPDNTTRDDRPTGILVDGPGSSIHIHTAANVRMGRGLWVRNTTGYTGSVGIVESHGFESDFSEYEAIRLEKGSGYWFTDTYLHGSSKDHNAFIGADVTNAQFHGGVCTGAGKGGWMVAGKEVVIAGMAIARNSVLVSGTYHGVELTATAASVRLYGAAVGRRENLTGLQGYGLSVASGAVRVTVAGCDMTGNATGAIQNGASAGEVKVRGCSGMTDSTDGISADGATIMNLGNGNGIAVKIGNSVGPVVNTMRLAGGASSNPVQILAEGADTDVDIKLTPKGAGLLQFSSNTTVATTPGNFSATRYLAIKDNSGTIFYIPCRSTTW